uniref:LacI family DNA-binding transcriptional regulator n=1 Tax=Geminicoccus flavidas TaxID=2506407 RepID=UPI00135B7473
MSRRATIRDVAMAAGVSIGTVSNVLTGARPVAASTRTAIEAAIERLGYAPDQAGRVLNSRRRRGPPAPPPGMPRLTTVGYLCADLTARLEVLPRADERAQARVIEETLGGAAANVAAVAAGLGPPLAVWTELMTRLGVDAHSDWAA